MNFIEYYSNLCARSRSLIWISGASLISGLLLMLWGAVLNFIGVGDSWLYELTALPADTLRFIYHPWTLFTYMWVHFSILHLLFNTLWLIWFGRMFAEAGRSSDIIKIFIGGGVAGGILFLVANAILDTESGGWLSGSSAAVLALICAAAIMMPRRGVNLLFIGEVSIKWVALICVALTLLGSGGSNSASLSAHMGGIMFGIIWGLSCRSLFKFRVSLPKIKARSETYSSEPIKRNINARAAAKAMTRLDDSERLDELLDKVRQSGYESLSAKEKTELNHISAKL